VANALYGTCFNRAEEFGSYICIHFLRGSPRGICFCTEPQKLKAGSITRNPPTETIGHAGAGGEKALTSIASLLPSGGEHI
jgi:hypothetical protein